MGECQQGRSAGGLMDFGLAPKMGMVGADVVVQVSIALCSVEKDVCEIEQVEFAL